jgi:hypothetical protein
MPDVPLTGHCLCGSVSYRCEGEPITTAICHCEDCQRQTGTTFSILVAVERTALQIEGETLSTVVTVASESGAERERTFCSNCGSPIASLPSEMPNLALIKAGTLDDRSWLEPQIEIWCDSAQPWLEAGQERRRFPTGIPA